MHEMGLATEIVRIVVESIPADVMDPKVERVNLKMGKMAAVVPQSLKFCFKIVAKDGPAEGAELHIEEIDVSANCHDCAHRWTLDQPAFQCPKCGGGDIEMLSGRELDIESIELAGD